MTATHNLVPFSRASDRGADAEMHQLLLSEIQVISPSIDQIMDFIARLRKVDGSDVDIEVALREALANAIVHGNQEDSQKRVYYGAVALQTERSRSLFRMRDKVLRAIQSDRGIHLMKTLIDEVRFEQRGVVVCMRKRSNARSDAKKETR